MGDRLRGRAAGGTGVRVAGGVGGGAGAVMPPGREFRRIYPERIGLFVDGRCVADYRPSGCVYRVRQFLPMSDTPYRQMYVSSVRVARAVCLEYSDQMEPET